MSLVYQEKNGSIKVGDLIEVHSKKEKHTVDKLGVFTPKRKELKILSSGQVGFVCASIKEIKGAPVGDTIIKKDSPAKQLPGFKEVNPQVFAALFPQSADDFESFREALEKLCINDASLHYEPEHSEALGAGFRCGFLGTLHMEIVSERLSREYGIELIATAPTVSPVHPFSDPLTLVCLNPFFNANSTAPSPASIVTNSSNNSLATNTGYLKS